MHVILYEPRLLFYHAARCSFESLGCKVTSITSSKLVEEFYKPYAEGVLFAIGVSGAGEDISSLLRAIYRLNMLNAKLVVWIPARDELLVRVMYGLGVQNLLCEAYIQEELPKRILNQNFSSQHLPRYYQPRGKGQCKTKLSCRELDILIDCSHGLNSYEIARSRHTSYKTVFTHKRNARNRLNLENSIQWLDLLTRLQQLRTF
ncbi:LuxR C-terminal-related transcriptional regulator [Enterobacter roggenkampii]|uniref:LuxR C-terminal-related transcriptional regulator n=1 Tax=Enterobacter roggenkampii TaxID=1812935 RepID=UPI001680C723|nr:LuxR C-terminal-related transcriptional regulator [Enterobacter roggenkampii]